MTKPPIDETPIPKAFWAKVHRGPNLEERQPPPKPKSSPKTTPKFVVRNESITVLLNPAGVGGWEKRKIERYNDALVEGGLVRREGSEFLLADNSPPISLISLDFSLSDLAPK